MAKQETYAAGSGEITRHRDASNGGSTRYGDARSGESTGSGDVDCGKVRNDGTSCSVREARYNDVPAILHLLEQVNMVHHLGRPDIFKKATKYTDDELKAIMDDPGQLLLVAEDGEGKVCGHAFCIFQQHLGSQLLTDIKTLYVDDICVDDGHRRQNIGTALYEAVRKAATEHDCHNITLNVWELNPGAMAFYRSLGLTPLKTMLEERL